MAHARGMVRAVRASRDAPHPLGGHRHWSCRSPSLPERTHSRPPPGPIKHVPVSQATQQRSRSLTSPSAIRSALSHPQNPHSRSPCRSLAPSPRPCSHKALSCARSAPSVTCARSAHMRWVAALSAQLPSERAYSFEPPSSVSACIQCPPPLSACTQPHTPSLSQHAYKQHIANPPNHL